MKKTEGFDAARKALSRLTPAESYPLSASLKRKLEEMFGTVDTEQEVKTIINEVRNRGDSAVLELTVKIDGVELTSL